MLSLRRRFQAYEGMGKIFIDVHMNEIIELTLWERLRGLFIEGVKFIRNIQLQSGILKKLNVDLEEMLKIIIIDVPKQMFLIES